MLTKVKMLSAAMILSTAVAAPTFAHSAKHNAANDQANLRGAYNQVVVAPSYSQENYGLAERDPSRVGGLDATRAASGG